MNCFLLVENLAFKKEAWINSKRHYKRHIRNRITQGHASRAVDGLIAHDIHRCTILDNIYGDNPVWTVDLGTSTDVSGVVIYTWQGFNEKSMQSFSNYILIFLMIEIKNPK